MRKWLTENRVLALVLIEVVAFILYTTYVFGTYSAQELVFDDNDMQVMNIDRTVSSGTYLDTSYESAKAVVSPAVSLDKGIYYITADYRGKGIMKAGLIYDPTRNGKEAVDDNEFILNPQENGVSYRVKIKNDSSVRFKIRLTPEAEEGDYVQLLNVRIVSARLTYVYFISVAGLFLIITDLLLLGYFRYYMVLSPKQKMIGIMLIVVAFMTVLPLYLPGLSSSADLGFHLQRIEGVYKGLLSGQFPVRIQPGWLNGNGYASSIFYGDIFMYFPAVLRMLGFTVQEAYKIYAGTINIATVFVSFYAFRKMTHEDIAATVGTVLYVCSGNRVSRFFLGRIGTYSAMIFYPLVIAGFYLFFTEDVKNKSYKKLWMLLTVGFSGLLMAHMLSSLMVGVVALLACLIMIKKVLRRETFTELCKAVFVTILLNMWYLIPLLQYMLTENLHINNNLTVEVNNYDKYVLLADFTQSGENLYSLFNGEDTIGYVLLLFLLFYLITIPIQKKTLYTKPIRCFFLYTIFALWMCTSYFPSVKLSEYSTVILKYFQTIQYQDRFLSVVVALAASFCAVFIASDMLNKKFLYLLAGLLCCFGIYQNLQYSNTVSSDEVYLDSVDLPSRAGGDGYSYGIGNAEFLPVATDTYRLTEEIWSDEMLRIIDYERKYLTYDMTVINATDQERSLIFPVIFYSGYRSYDMQNQAELYTAAGDNGCVEVKVPAGYSGTFRMAFHEPWFWRMAEVISLLTLGFIIYYEGKRHGTILSMKNKVQKGA